MRTIQAALYARVSSDQQAQAQTIQSQLAALRTRVQADDGYFCPTPRKGGLRKFGGGSQLSGNLNLG
jgi:hypothetical protein